MIRRHPRTAALEAWLAGTSHDADVDAHLAHCQRCANLLEELEGGADTPAPLGFTSAPSPIDVGQALAEALAPPADLTERLVARVNAKLSSRQVMGVVADLFGAGIETTRLLLIEDPDDNN